MKNLLWKPTAADGSSAAYVISRGRPIILVLALLLAGCGLTSTGDLARSTVATKGAQVMDEGLVNAEWWICNGASIGSIKRRYGTSQEMANIYWGFCYKENHVDVIGPVPPE